MELNIDGKPCDLGSERIAVPGYDAAALADVVHFKLKTIDMVESLKSVE